MMNPIRKCQSFKTSASGNRRCAHFTSTSEERDTAMHRSAFAGLPGLNMSVNTGDLLAGSAVGLLAGSGARWLANKYATAWLPPMVMRFVPVLGGAVAAGALYYYSASAGKKARGVSHAAGALGAAVVVNVWDMLRAQFPSLADLSSYAGYGYLTNGISPNSGSPGVQSYQALVPDTTSYQALVPDTTGYQGIVMDTGNPAMNELALSAMGPDEGDQDYGF